MKRHMWMHISLLVAIVVVFGLSAVGVTVPSAVIYLVVLACPLMMVFMMVGMNHRDEPGSGHDHGTSSASPHDHSPADAPK